MGFIVVGRNSHFHDLTKEEHDELGGVEYRALRILFWIVLLASPASHPQRLILTSGAVLHLLPTIRIHHHGTLHCREKLPRRLPGAIPIRPGILVLRVPSRLGVLEYGHVALRSVNGAVPERVCVDCWYVRSLGLGGLETDGLASRVHLDFRREYRFPNLVSSLVAPSGAWTDPGFVQLATYHVGRIAGTLDRS